MQAICCPACDNAFVHHFQVDVYEREQDAKEGLHVQVLGVDTNPERLPSFTAAPSLTGNPSDRRQGLTVHLRCEKCRGVFLLTLAQHKGHTLLDVCAA